MWKWQNFFNHSLFKSTPNPSVFPFSGGNSHPSTQPFFEKHDPPFCEGGGEGVQSLLSQNREGGRYARDNDMWNHLIAK